jgi:Tfp pilus assembly protein PilW
MHKRRASQNGFTLIELLLYVVIASTLLVILSTFLSLLLGAQVKGQAITEVDGQGTSAIQVITQAIRNADGATSPATSTSATSLTLVVATSSLSPTIFDIASGTLRMKEGANAAIALTSSKVIASALSFANLSRTGTPSAIRVQFTLSYANPTGRSEYSVVKTFYASASLR